MSDSLQSHRLQHAGFPVHHQLLELAQTHVLRVVLPPNHLILYCPLLLPSIMSSIGSFPMSQFFTSNGQTIGVSVPASVLTMNIQDWFPLGLTGLISWLNSIHTHVCVCVCVCVYKTSFIHSWALRWFHILAIMDNNTINMLVQITLQYPVFNTFGYIPSSGTAGSHGGSIFKFLWNFCSFFLS